MKQTSLLLPLLLLLSLPLGADIFERMGAIPGTPTAYSEATAISADGSIIAGMVFFDGPVNDAVRWANGELAYLGKTPSDNADTISVTAMSGDGTKIVGQTLFSNAYLWNDGTLATLPQLQVAGPAMTIVNDISDDGTVMVGTNGPPNVQALLWVNGVVNALGYLDSSHGRAVATAVSADGKIVVGQTRDPFEPVGGAFRWEGGQMTALGHLEQDENSIATDISADGTVIVGNSESRAQGFLVMRAFMWKDGNMTELPRENPDLNIIFERTEAVAVSGDGSVIVGMALDSVAEGESANLGNQPVVWSAANNYRPVPLISLFTEEELLGFTVLNYVADVSRDGRIIVGYGTNLAFAFEGFKITLEPDSTLTWAGYPVFSDGQSVDTGSFLGWIDISAAPWVYIYAIGRYVYLPENFVTPSGSWMWIGR